MIRQQLGTIERLHLIERLARRFYKLQGCNFPEDKMMQESNHPAEKLCVAMAIAAIEEFELARA